MKNHGVEKNADTDRAGENIVFVSAISLFRPLQEAKFSISQCHLSFQLVRCYALNSNYGLFSEDLVLLIHDAGSTAKKATQAL